MVGKIILFPKTDDKQEHTNEQGCTAITTGHAHSYPYCMVKSQDGTEFVCTVTYEGWRRALERFDEWQDMSVQDAARWFFVAGIPYRHYMHAD